MFGFLTFHTRHIRLDIDYDLYMLGIENDELQLSFGV